MGTLTETPAESRSKYTRQQLLVHRRPAVQLIHILSCFVIRIKMSQHMDDRGFAKAELVMLNPAAPNIQTGVNLVARDTCPNGYQLVDADRSGKKSQFDLVSWQLRWRRRTSSQEPQQGASSQSSRNRSGSCRSRPGRCWRRQGSMLSFTRQAATSRKSQAKLTTCTNRGKTPMMSL